MEQADVTTQAVSVPVKRTRKCKSLVACIEAPGSQGSTFQLVDNFPVNLVSKDKATAWLTKNAADNKGPRDIILLRPVARIQIHSALKFSAKVQ